MLRKAILAAAESPRLQRVVRRHGMRLGAGRFVAGETLDQAVVVLRRLNESGLQANTTLLGEGVNSEAETRAVVDAYRAILDRIAAERPPRQCRPQADPPRARRSTRRSRARTSASSSPTRRGAGTSSGSTWRSRRSSTRRCASSGRFARTVTRTWAPCCSRTSTARRPISRGSSTWRRTSASSRARTSSRPTVAYPEKSDVDPAYARLIERSLSAGGFTAVATHDRR